MSMINHKKLAFLTISVVAMLLILGSAVLGQVPQRNDIYRYLSIFSEVLSLVRTNYVDEIAPDKLVDGAFTGATEAIDEYSSYIPPQQRKQFEASLEDKRPGVGLVVSKRFGYAYVIAPVPGSPADKAGIKPGDFLERIDDKPTESMPVWQLEAALRGTGDKPLQLRILRGGMTRRENIAVTPAPFDPSAASLEYHGTVAVLRIPVFTDGSMIAIEEKLTEIRKSGRDKLIVDVRGNASGSVEEAVRVADAFLVKGTITSVAGRRVEKKSWAAAPESTFDGQIEVLTDGSTSGAAEVFASALRDNQRGKIVGLTTYGKAIVQKFVPLPSGGGLLMTIGHYTTPELKPITEQGVRPDVIVDLALDSLAEEGEEKPDLILRKALTLFGEKEARSAA